jgi:hypothetical protein
MSTKKEGLQKNQVDEMILSFLSDGNATPTMSIVRHCNCRESTVRTRMRHLSEQGKIKRVAVNAKDLRIAYYALVK